MDSDGPGLSDVSVHRRDVDHPVVLFAAGARGQSTRPRDACCPTVGIDLCRGDAHQSLSTVSVRASETLWRSAADSAVLPGCGVDLPGDPESTYAAEHLRSTAGELLGADAI